MFTVIINIIIIIIKQEINKGMTSVEEIIII